MPCNRTRARAYSSVNWYAAIAAVTRRTTPSRSAAGGRNAKSSPATHALAPSHSLLLAGIVNNCSIPGESIQVARADRRRGGSTARQQSGSSTGPQPATGEESESEGKREKIRRQRRNPRLGRDRAETNGPLHTPREREIKHCATVFHPETSTKREVSPSHSHASTGRRLADSRCTKRRC